MLAIGGKSCHYGRGSRLLEYLEVSTAQQQVNGDTFSLLGSQQRRVYVVQVSMAATSNSYLKRKREESKVNVTRISVTALTFILKTPRSKHTWVEPRPLN